MPFFGDDKKKPTATTFKLRPRQPGDPAIPAAIESQLRAAGIDPATVSLAPADAKNLDAALAGVPSGRRLRHTFSFTTLQTAFTAIEQVIGDDTVASISKDSDGWLVVFDASDEDASDQDPAAHARFVDRIVPLGGTDRGFVREMITRRYTAR